MSKLSYPRSVAGEVSLNAPTRFSRGTALAVGVRSYLFGL